MPNKQTWRDWLILAVGIWLLSAPLFMSYGSTTSVAAWDSYVVGALIAIFAASSLWSPAWRLSSAEKWINLVLAPWLLAAPFALAFYESGTSAAWTHIIVGLLIGAEAIWALSARPSPGSHIHEQ